MSQSKDIDEQQVDPDRLWLVDLLYGELEGDDARHAEQRVHADRGLAAELEDFHHLRSMMRELPDEEPPQSVTAKLLHAAAIQAPAAAAAKRAQDDPDGGLWARLRDLFQPVFMYPGLAAAASLVLVATVAGTVYLTGNEPVSEPIMADRKPALQPATEGEVPEARGELAATPGGMGVDETTPGGMGVDEIPGGMGVDDVAPAAAAPQRVAAAGDGAEKTAKEEVSQDPPSATGSRANRTRGKRATKAGLLGEQDPLAEGRTARLYEPEPAKPGNVADARYAESKQAPAKKAKPRREPAPPRSSASSGPTAKGVARDSLDLGAPDDQAENERKAPPQQNRRPAPAPPEPEAEPAPRRSAADAPDERPARGKDKSTRADERAEQDDEDSDSGSDEADRAERVRTLYRQALAAAKKNECASVRAKIREIRALDSAYYRKRVASNKALARCIAQQGKK